MLASEAALDVMAVYVVVIAFLSNVAGYAFAVPPALRRWRRYKDDGSRRTYAQKELFQALGLTFMSTLFLLTGLITATLGDTDIRAILARLLVLAVATILAALIVVGPVANARTEMQREEEVSVHRQREDAE